jgi:hypothetical protein
MGDETARIGRNYFFFVNRTILLKFLAEYLGTLTIHRSSLQGVLLKLSLFTGDETVRIGRNNFFVNRTMLLRFVAEYLWTLMIHRSNFHRVLQKFSHFTSDEKVLKIIVHRQLRFAQLAASDGCRGSLYCMVNMLPL